jgi:hypothetical protein
MKALALSVLVLGAAASAYACGDDKKDNAQASYTSTSGSSCASKMTKEAGAAKMAAGECKAHASNTAVLAGADHCASGTKDAAMAVYGENTVTFAGACAPLLRKVPWKPSTAPPSSPCDATARSRWAATAR